MFASGTPRGTMTTKRSALTNPLWHNRHLLDSGVDRAGELAQGKPERCLARAESHRHDGAMALAMRWTPRATRSVVVLYPPVPCLSGTDRQRHPRCDSRTPDPDHKYLKTGRGGPVSQAPVRERIDRLAVRDRGLANPANEVLRLAPPSLSSAEVRQNLCLR